VDTGSDSFPLLLVVKKLMMIDRSKTPKKERKKHKYSLCFVYYLCMRACYWTNLCLWRIRYNYYLMVKCILHSLSLYSFCGVNHLHLFYFHCYFIIPWNNKRTQSFVMLTLQFYDSTQNQSVFILHLYVAVNFRSLHSTFVWCCTSHLNQVQQY
jgi:hypothetical protein